MDIDFPLILSWAVLISGAIWLFDAVLLAPRRRRAAEALPGGIGKANDDAVEAVLEEPVLVEYARSFFPVLLLVLLLRSFLVEPFQIPSESMMPTLEVGDFILVNKYAYGLRLPVLGTKILDVGMPERGDVMVFIPPHEPRYFIKRVVGLPGDTIRYEEKTLYVNGDRVAKELVGQYPKVRPYFKVYEETLGDAVHRIIGYPGQPEKEGVWTVPEDHYFMMGDNRGRSEDSRFWGYVPEENIVGKAFAVWLHKDEGWHLPTFAENRFIE